MPGHEPWHDPAAYGVLIPQHRKIQFELRDGFQLRKSSFKLCTEETQHATCFVHALDLFRSEQSALREVSCVLIERSFRISRTLIKVSDIRHVRRQLLPHEDAGHRLRPSQNITAQPQNHIIDSCQDTCMRYDGRFAAIYGR